MSNNKDFKVKNGIKPTVYHEAMGTVVSGSVGYSLANASYDGVSFSVAGQEANAYEVFFKPDGTKMYIVGTGGVEVNEYDLSTAWDITTSTFNQLFSVSTEEQTPTSLFFKPDGTKMYILGFTGDDVNEYTLSTAWDISTATYNQNFSVSSEETLPFSLFFKPDGTKMYMVGLTGVDVNEYTLSTAWDISTASYSQNFSVSSEQSSPYGVFFKPDGTKMYMVGTVGKDVDEYDLSTAWDISTATYSQLFSLSSQILTPRGIFFKPDGTKMYVVEGDDQSIHQYSTILTTNTLDLSTGSVFEITPTSDIQVTLSNPADSGTVSQATLLLDGVATSTYDITAASASTGTLDLTTESTSPAAIFIGDSGTKFYVFDAGSYRVYQYSLSTPNDITTATYDSKNFLTGSQDSNPRGLYFTSDGLNMITVGSANERVYRYSLSTAWDVSTASYPNDFYTISAQSISQRGVFLKSDGTKFYINDDGGNAVEEYTMSTAYDVSTASHTNTFSLGSDTWYGLSFNADGTSFFIHKNGGIEFREYSMTTAWDTSTASLANTFIVAASGAYQFHSFATDGKSFVIYNATDTQYEQYSTTAGAVITYDTSIEWPSGTAPTSPAIGETDVITFSTTDGGTTYQAAVAIDGAS